MEHAAYDLRHKRGASRAGTGGLHSPLAPRLARLGFGGGGAGEFAGGGGYNGGGGAGPAPG